MSVVEDMEEVHSTVTVSLNNLAADYTGKIAYGRGGRAPLRRPGSSGVLPLPAWELDNLWRGLTHSHTILLNAHNQYITANNELYFGETQRVVGFNMGEYRAGRIHHLLHHLTQVTADV